jgi:molecular chaperone Hsp33
VLEVFTSKSIYYECQQERERFENIVLNLGEEEARKLLKERGEIAIHVKISSTSS